MLKISNNINITLFLKSVCKYIILFFPLFYCQMTNATDNPNNFKATWAGIEIFGVSKSEAQKIRTLIPIRIGTPFTLAEKENYLSMCNIVADKMKYDDVNCTFVLFGDGQAYFVVEIAAIGAKKNMFRIIPKKKGSIAVLPDEFNRLYDQWDKRMYFLISNGNPVGDKYKKGILDFDDPILHDLAIKMSKYAYKYNNQLLDALLYSPSADERYKAATLLVWAQHHEENLAFILKWDLLNDPDRGVRNYLSRSFSSLMPEVKDESLLENLIPVYCQQATLPSHTDRNKALFSLLGILEANPKLVAAVNSECKNTITYISEVSILENVGGVAKDILEIINKKVNSNG